MDHTVNIRMCLEDLFQISLLSDIHIMKLWSFAAYKLNAIERHFRGIVEIVNNHDFVAIF